MEQQRHYTFSWNLIGDVEAGRPSLGSNAPVAAYRLFQYSLRDVLEQRYGLKEADDILREAGFVAGRHFAAHIIGQTESLGSFFRKLQEALRSWKMGLLRMEEATPEQWHFILTVAEDLDCSGLPETGINVCAYDEGFISGLLFAHTGKRLQVREVDCWCTGGKTCRFEVTLPTEHSNALG